MKAFNALCLIFLALICAACQSKATVCLAENPDAPVPFVTPLPTQASPQNPDLYIAPAMVKIGSKHISVDNVVHGDICDDTWSGVVYVDCDVQVAEWEEVPNFLDDCSLSIEPGAIIYVADHNNQAFYKGCSCHYTDERFPGTMAAP